MKSPLRSPLLAAQKAKVSPAKARELEIPNRRAFQPIGKRGAGIRFERHGMRTDLHGVRPVLVVEFHGAVQTPVAHREAWIVEAHEGGDRHFRSRWYPAARGFARRGSTRAESAAPMPALR